MSFNLQNLVMIVLQDKPGPWQYLFTFIVMLCVFVFPLFVVLYRREIPEHSIPLWAKLLLIIPSITLVGIAIMSYIIFRKKIYKDERIYKFDKPTRYYAMFLLGLSILASVLWLILPYLKTG